MLEIFMDHCRLKDSQNSLLLPSAVAVRQSQLSIRGDFSMDPQLPPWDMNRTPQVQLTQVATLQP